MKNLNACKPTAAIRGRVLATLMALIAFVCLPATAYGQGTHTVSGTVIDELGEPLIGASVTATGLAGGVTTDIDGNYTIKVPAGTKSLTFSYVGYATATFDIAGATLEVTMRPSREPSGNGGHRLRHAEEKRPHRLGCRRQRERLQQRRHFLA